MKEHHKRAISLTLVLIIGISASAAAQEKSINPEINKQFADPDVTEFVGRFEREGRDAYDHREAIVEACHLKPGEVVADIGAGTGLFTLMFAKQVGSQGRVYAVDPTDKFVRHIEEGVKRQGLTNVAGVVCSQQSVNLPEASIDLAFICDTYHHFEFPERTVRSIHRALKPGGRLILIDFHRVDGVSSDWILNHVRAGQDVFCQEVAAAGFRQVEEKKDLLKESYFVRFEKVDDKSSRAR